MATYSLVILPSGLHRQRSLVGYSPWGLKESDTTEQLSLLYFQSHGFLHSYRKIQYWGQTIQGGLETVGFYGHNLILSISTFFLNCENEANFFFQNNAVSQDSWKRQLGLNLFFFFFSISASEKKSQLYKLSVYICPNIHCV